MTKECFLNKELETAEQRVQTIKTQIEILKKQEEGPTVRNIIEKEGVIVHGSEDYGSNLFVQVDPNGHDFTTITRPIYTKLGYVMQGFSITAKDSVKIWWKKPEDF